MKLKKTFYCKQCGAKFSPSYRTQQYCLAHHNPADRYFGPKQEEKLLELKARADNAFAKIYTANEYSQEFLRSLIPSP